MRKISLWAVFTLLALITSPFLMPNAEIAFAESVSVSVPAKSYESDERYKFANSIPVLYMTYGRQTLGEFSLVGDIYGTTEHLGRYAYGVERGNLSFSYRFDGHLLNGNSDTWQLSDDGVKSVDGIPLIKSIGKGAIIVQTSLDGNTWESPTISVNNLFADNPTGLYSFYSTTDDDINRGTFYRITVAYQTKKKTGTTDILIYHSDNFDYRYHVEVYEFYASTNSGIIAVHDLAVEFVDSYVEPVTFESGKQYYIDESAPVQQMSFGDKTIGSMYISGQIVDKTTNAGVTTFFTARDKVFFSYSYDSSLLTEIENGQILNSDQTNNVDGIALNEKMGTGVLILQSSNDRKTWENAINPIVNFFENYSAGNPVFYIPDENEIAGGTYYRAIVAYETRTRTGKTNLFVTQIDNYEYHKHVEIYEFYVTLSEDIISTDLFLGDSSIASYGFEIDKLGTPFEVYVNDTLATDEERFVANGIYTIKVKTIFGKDVTKTIQVINGQEAGKQANAILEEQLSQATETPEPTPVLALTPPPNTTRYYLGTTKNAGNDSGYSKSNTIVGNDPHFGWDIGRFFVSGFTRVTKDETSNPVFLKVPGDKVALWFTLEQDIEHLNEKDTISVVYDNNGYDEYFAIEKTDFGRGALIIKHIDYQNSAAKPTIYVDYLSAKATYKADTTVELFEEGDYEVALNYKVMQDNPLIDNYSSYRIFFRFSVRNGNCMVYPFDVATKAELTSNAITENGFYLDLARSRYLEITIRKEVLVDGSSGIIEDMRFNRPAKDGDQYTEEGIYTITVKNRYTGEQTIKKIVVGTNKTLEAFLNHGLNIEDIQIQH